MPLQRRSSVIQTTHHRALHDFVLRGLLLITNVNSAMYLLLYIAQSKHRHVLSSVHLLHQGKKLKSNGFYNSVPLRARVIKKYRWS